MGHPNWNIYVINHEEKLTIMTERYSPIEIGEVYEAICIIKSSVCIVCKGSMKNNLDILEKDGLIQSRELFTVRGPKLIYEITKEGKNVHLEISRLLTIQNK